MSSDRRWVLIPVDDPRVTELAVISKREEGFDSGLYPWKHVPVPSDDQVTRDIDLITREMVESGGSWPYPAEREAAVRLRTYFQLDQEDD